MVQKRKIEIFLGADILYINIKKTTGPIFAVDLTKNGVEKIFSATTHFSLAENICGGRVERSNSTTWMP